jgi:tetratricopeptide (TPR) repeat protein
MGGVLDRRVKNGPQSALDGLASIEEKYSDPALLFYRVLIADQQFRLRRMLADAAAPGDRARILAGAFAAYTELMKVPYPAGTIPRDTLRSIAFARLTTAAAASGPDVDASQLPAIVAVARADALSADPATRDQAIVSLESALGDSSLAADDRAAALFVLARALFEAGQPLLAAQRFEELARDNPTDPQAERAIELAAMLAWEEHRRAPEDAQTRKTLRETLDLLLVKYANLASIDRWQYAAGRLALVERRYDDSIKRFEKVTPNAAEWLDANFMQAAAAHERATAAGAGTAAQTLHQQTQQVIAKVRPEIEKGLAATADAARQASLQYYLAMLRVYAADSTLAMGDPQKAIDALAGIESDATAGSDAIGEAMRVRINAYQALRPPKPDEALRDLQRFVQASPQQAGAVLQPMIASLAADVQKLIDAGQAEQAKTLALSTLMPAVKTLETWLQTPDAPSDPDARASLERRVADAYRFAGDCETATVIYARLLRARPDASDLLLGQAECLFALGGDQRLADAMGLYKRLGASGPSAGASTYWLAQLRMLQILDATNRGTQQIVPRIERLRQSDAEFGGERYRQGFEALRAKHAGK